MLDPYLFVHLDKTQTIPQEYHYEAQPILWVISKEDFIPSRDYWE